MSMSEWLAWGAFALTMGMALVLILILLVRVESLEERMDDAQKRIRGLAYDLAIAGIRVSSWTNTNQDYPFAAAYKHRDPGGIEIKPLDPDAVTILTQPHTLRECCESYNGHSRSWARRRDCPPWDSISELCYSVWASDRMHKGAGGVHGAKLHGEPSKFFPGTQPLGDGTTRIDVEPRG